MIQHVGYSLWTSLGLQVGNVPVEITNVYPIENFFKTQEHQNEVKMNNSYYVHWCSISCEFEAYRVILEIPDS